MAGRSIYFLEDKSPGNVCYLADNLRVHKVAETDKTSRYSCGDGDIIEYTKEIQEAFEATLPLDMGQILSIPFIIIGVYCMIRAKKVKQ